MTLARRNNNETEFPRLEQLFVPIFHTLMLVWQHSKTYNNKRRLVCLLQEISNGLVRQVLPPRITNWLLSMQDSVWFLLMLAG